MINIIAEIGINHNGNLDNVYKLIDIASAAGINFVKFQKRNPDICVPENQKNKEKIVPWREEPTTYLQYKKDIEFTFEDYDIINEYCSEKNIDWFASVWDEDSVDFMYDIGQQIVKIPSALLTNLSLLERAEYSFPFRILSTGMSTEEEIDKAVEVLNPQVIMHTNSTYPSPIEDLNFGYIEWLKEKYPKKEIGFSSHYYGIVPLMASVLLRVSWIEFHVTLDHSAWGSDQLSSIEPSGIFKAVKGVRDLEMALSKGYGPRKLLPGEDKKRKTLRK